MVIKNSNIHLLRKYLNMQYYVYIFPFVFLSSKLSSPLVLAHTVTTTTTTQTTTPAKATLQIINSNEFPADDVAIKNIGTYSSASHQEKPGFLQSVKMLFTGADKEIIHHEKDINKTSSA